MIIKILDTEIEVDLLNPDVIELYETEKDKAAQIANDAMSKNEKMSDCVRAQCKAIINCLDNVLGVGMAEQIMGKSTDLIKCLDAFIDFCQAYNRYAIPAINQKTKEILAISAVAVADQDES